MSHMSSPDMWKFMEIKNQYEMHDLHLGRLSVKIKKIID